MSTMRRRIWVPNSQIQSPNNRFTELMQSATLPLCIFLKTCCLGQCTGISFVDSTPIRVCKNKRIKRNKVFKGIAQLGKSSMGFFFGFKLHLIINDKGEILNFVITQGNVDDREPLKNERFIESVKGKLYGDKGYISKELTNMLFVDGLHLVTSIKSKMKNCLMELKDKILLRKRSVIETVNDELKNMCQVEHSWHRPFGNFITNLVSGIVAYCFPLLEAQNQKNQQSNSKLKTLTSCQCFYNRTQVFKGRPSYSSTAIDQIAFDPEAPQLIFVSGGNVGIINPADYPSKNFDESIQYPGKAYNAITVGSYTRKDRFPTL